MKPKTPQQIDAMSGRELVEYYNALTGSTLKKFETRKAGIARILAAHDAMKPAPKAGAFNRGQAASGRDVGALVTTLQRAQRDADKALTRADIARQVILAGFDTAAVIAVGAKLDIDISAKRARQVRRTMVRKGEWS